MKNLFTNIITIQDFKEYQSGWSENFEDNQIQDAINIATNDLNAYTNFLLEKVYIYNTGEDVKQNNPLWRNELEMKALKMSVLSQTYYKLMNGNDNSIGDASYSGSGISMSQSLPERNYISEDVLQWLVNARLMENNNHKHHCEDFIECKEISMNPLELAKKPYPDPIYVPSKFINFTPFNLLQINQNGYVVQSTVDEVMKNWTIPEYLITYIEEYVLGVLGEDIEALKKQVEVINTNIEVINTNINTINENITNLDNNKSNINLSNVNVGEGKEDKLLSFDANGAPKFIDQVQPSSFILNYLSTQEIQLESGVKYKLNCDGLCIITFNNEHSSFIYDARLKQIGGTIPKGTEIEIGEGSSFTIEKNNNDFIYLLAQCSPKVRAKKDITTSNYNDSFASLFDGDINGGSATVPGNLEFEYRNFYISITSPYWFVFDAPLYITYFGTKYTPIDNNASIYKELDNNGNIIGLYHQSALPIEKSGRRFEISTLEERNKYRKTLNRI